MKSKCVNRLLPCGLWEPSIPLFLMASLQDCALPCLFLLEHAVTSCCPMAAVQSLSCAEVELAPFCLATSISGTQLFSSWGILSTGQAAAPSILTDSTDRPGASLWSSQTHVNLRKLFQHWLPGSWTWPRREMISWYLWYLLPPPHIYF